MFIQNLVIANSPAITMVVEMCLLIHRVQVFGGIKPVLGLLDFCVIWQVYFQFVRISPHCLPLGLHYVAFSMAVSVYSPFSASSPAFVTFCVLNPSYSYRGDVIPYCDFNFWFAFPLWLLMNISPSPYNYWTFLFFWEVSIEVLCSFLNWIVSFLSCWCV